jgi:hypothetical protein
MPARIRTTSAPSAAATVALGAAHRVDAGAGAAADHAAIHAAIPARSMTARPNCGPPACLETTS